MFTWRETVRALAGKLMNVERVDFMSLSQCLIESLADFLLTFVKIGVSRFVESPINRVPTIFPKSLFSCTIQDSVLNLN